MIASFQNLVIINKFFINYYPLPGAWPHELKNSWKFFKITHSPSLFKQNLIWFNSILHNLVPFCSLFYIKLSITITFFYIISCFPLTPCHCIAAATARDRKVQGSIIPRASNHDDATRWLGWGLKSSKKHTSTFFKTVNLLPKDLRFEHEGAKLASCPGAISPRYPLINAIPTVRTGVRCVGRGGGGKPPAWKISWQTLFQGRSCS